MITFLLALAVNFSQPSDTKIIYVGDPMCSWCYGASNELLEVQKHFEGKIPFEVVLGGLRPYNEQSMLDLKSFLTHHWEEVSKASGQEFNYGILDSKDITYDTEPPCRATVLVRKLKPEATLDFFKAVQRAFYFDNKNLHLLSSYEPILKNLDIDVVEFNRLFESAEMKEAVRADFQRATDLGVSGFPTLLMQRGDQTEIIASGYKPAAEMILIIEKFLAK